ncbi:MAG: undecaprenyl-diphosphate phosphatase [Planctomycetaceae bacterium]|nr:undecaprenyl-diphosphate phosphatase [Planctomycetaceae bacterium]
MVEWWELILLSVVQGIAEFLPISSSGHLVVLEHWLDIKSDLSDINIILHAGTLLAILLVYRQRIFRMLFQDVRLLGLVVLGTIPAVIFGLGVKLLFEGLLESPLIAGVCLPVTAILLFWTDRSIAGELRSDQLSWKQAFGIGCAQAAAVLPGISRSGSTIAAGLAAGLNRAEAATFSFLLAIPALSGAAVLELASSLSSEKALQTSVSMLVVGALISAVVGWVSLKGLLTILQKGRLRIFGVWCLILGVVVLCQFFLSAG